MRKLEPTIAVPLGIFWYKKYQGGWRSGSKEVEDSRKEETHKHDDDDDDDVYYYYYEDDYDDYEDDYDHYVIIMIMMIPITNPKFQRIYVSPTNVFMIQDNLRESDNHSCG